MLGYKNMYRWIEATVRGAGGFALTTTGQPLGGHFAACIDVNQN
jgi:hypothetical protein